MKTPSFLVGLSGTKQSMYAAELAWTLAAKTNARVTALHVIDTHTPWNMLRVDEPGFIGSGLYITAFEKLKESQRTIANHLTEKYDAVAESQRVTTDSLVVEGNPVQEICREAVKHDLVIVGHSPSREGLVRDRWHWVNYTVAEGLAHDCQKPLLVVQHQAEQLWRQVRILLSVDHVNLAYIRASLAAAQYFQAEPVISCLMTGTHEEPVFAFAKDFIKSLPELADLTIETQLVTGVAVDSKLSLWEGASHQAGLTLAGDLSDSLVIMPTRQIGSKRISILGLSADEFVRQLSLPAVLLWPEESIHPNDISERKLEQVSI